MKTISISLKSQLLGSCLVLLFCFTTHAQLKVVGYVSNTQSTTVDYNKITHLNIAFENPDAAGNLSFNAINTTYIQQAHANGKKVLVSIAGGYASEDATMKARYFNLISDANRTAFVSKITDYVIAHNFDGLDVDLEGSAINSDYGKFITALSAALKPQNKLLTSALSHVNGGANVPDDAMLLFDYINIMAYDATGPWNPSNPGQHSSFDFAVASLDYWTGRGLPKANAVLGVPFYGYGFGNDFNEGISYAQIVTTYPGAENRDVSGNTIYYNGIPTIRQKTQYVLEEEYGGIMIWNLAQDRNSADPKSLLRTIDHVINPVMAAEGEEGEETLSIFPNPIDATLNIKAWSDFRGGHFSITDRSGKEFFESTVTSDSIDVSVLPSGLYILRLTKDQRSARGKFIKR